MTNKLLEMKSMLLAPMILKTSSLRDPIRDSIIDVLSGSKAIENWNELQVLEAPKFCEKVVKIAEVFNDNSIGRIRNLNIEKKSINLITEGDYDLVGEVARRISDLGVQSYIHFCLAFELTDKKLFVRAKQVTEEMIPCAFKDRAIQYINLAEK